MRITSKPLSLPGAISITRSSDDTIRISIEDKVSGTRVLEAKMALGAFAEAITGLGNQPIGMELYAHAPWGKRRQTKQHPVKVANDLPNYARQPEQFRAAAALALEPHQRDGWIGSDSDIGNMHRGLRWEAGLLYGMDDRDRRSPVAGGEVFARPEEGERYYMVSFVRWVDQPEAQGEPEAGGEQ